MTVASAPTAARGAGAMPPPRRRRRRLRSRPSSVLTAVSAFVAAVFILPAVWILVGSFRPTVEIFGSLSPLGWGLLIPESVSLDNYIGLLSSGFGRAVANSLVVCLASVVIGVVVCALAAYPLAVLQFRGRSALFAAVVISFMVPFEAIAIPLSQMFGDVGLTDTLIGLVLPGIGNGLAIFNLRQFFMSVPASLREAATIDGASEPRVLLSIYLPLSTAALTNSALLIFLGQWTSYLWPLLIITEPELQVAPVALAKTFSEYTFNYGQQFAGAVILSLIPALLMFILLRFFGNAAITSGEK